MAERRKLLNSTSVRVRLEKDYDMEAGKPIFVTRSFPNVEETISATDLDDAIRQLLSLQKYPVYVVNYIENYEIF